MKTVGLIRKYCLTVLWTLLGCSGSLGSFSPVNLHLRQIGSFWALHVSKMPQGGTACLILVFSSLVCWFMTKNSKKKLQERAKTRKGSQKCTKIAFLHFSPKDPSAIFFRQLFPKRTAQTFQTIYEPPMICFFWPGLCSAPLWDGRTVQHWTWQSVQRQCRVKGGRFITVPVHLSTREQCNTQAHYHQILRLFFNSRLLLRHGRGLSWESRNGRRLIRRA